MINNRKYIEENLEKEKNCLKKKIRFTQLIFVASLLVWFGLFIMQTIYKFNETKIPTIIFSIVVVISALYKIWLNNNLTSTLKKQAKLIEDEYEEKSIKLKEKDITMKGNDNIDKSNED